MIMTIDNKPNSLKILLVGDSGTGKTGLVSRLTRNDLDLDFQSTSVIDNITYDILMDDDEIVKADIWDIAGCEKYRNLAKSLFNDADGIFLVYDISDYTTFENISGWLGDIIPLAHPKTVIKLIGNKSDLDLQRAVPTNEAEQWAADYGISFTETSALDSTNVTVMFQWMIQQICTTRNSVLVPENSDHLFSTCGFISNYLPCQEQSFHIILVDLKKAGIDREIHCVEKSLKDNNDLNYVALSYRWGELQETVFDTQIGYSATITSFDLCHFCDLCEMILVETDLKDMDYIWVDAICVDQTNYDRRKSTIHQMSNIYERANYILAVPDLHMEHLKNTSTSSLKVMDSSSWFRKDLYYLIHGNLDQLASIEEEWLDEYNVPNDPDVRQLLKVATDHFADSLIKCRVHHEYYNGKECLNHIYETTNATSSSSPTPSITEDNELPPLEELERLPQHGDCHQLDCPLDFVGINVPEWRENRTRKKNKNNDTDQQWNQYIQKRSSSIRQSMDFMGDLIKDWSSRVWVISEYNIARKKNNMKYWFIQLGNMNDVEDFTFFKFDFDANASVGTQYDITDPSQYTSYSQINASPHVTFHYDMFTQLNEQTFFEMMLKSKASNHEDRFYAIFPLTKYKNMITNKGGMDSFHIHTLTSVRLKLFELLDTKDKLNLLFFSCNWNALYIGEGIPTFATSYLNWDAPTEYFILDKDIPEQHYNFDLDSNHVITLYHPSSTLHFLNLKPKEYYLVDYDAVNSSDQNDWYDFEIDELVWNRLQPEQDPCETNVIVCIPSWTQSAMKEYSGDYIHWDDHVVFLNGNFENNIWIMEPDRYHFANAPDFKYWIRHITDHTSPGFNIY